jgi:hypothetical protein
MRAKKQNNDLGGRTPFLNKKLFVLLCFFLVGCSYSKKDMELEIKNIKTSNDEAVFFQSLNGKEFSCIFLDSKLRRISNTMSNFVDRVSYVVFFIGEDRLKYSVINSTNVFDLMLE